MEAEVVAWLEVVAAGGFVVASSALVFVEELVCLGVDVGCEAFAAAALWAGEAVGAARLVGGEGEAWGWHG